MQHIIYIHTVFCAKFGQNLPLAQQAKKIFNGVYDVFAANNATTNISNSIVNRAYIQNHGNLIVSGTSKVNEIVSNPLVGGTLTINEGAQVTTVDIKQYSDKYPPKVTIAAGATIGTLQLNSINKKNINIDDNATIDEIIHNGVTYTSIAAFKAAE